jgi:hypothetical protein
MCQFFSGIITKKETIFDFDFDSHEKLIEKAGLKDTTNSPDFVRVELLPKDGNIFNHDLDNWILKIDQDFKPKWFSDKFAEEEMKKAIKQVWNERFIIKGKIDKINKGRWFIGGSAQVKNIYGSAQVENIYDSAQVENIYDSAQVKNIYDSAQVKYIYGSAQVKYIYDSAQVKNIYDSAQVKKI